MNEKHFTRGLDCVLTKSEVAAYSQGAAELELERQAAEHEEQLAKATAKKWKDKAVTLDNDSRDLLTKVRTGKEIRDVDCVEGLSVEGDRVLTHRTDTGEMIGSRGLLESDRQGGLFRLPDVESSDERDVEDRRPA